MHIRLATQSVVVEAPRELCFEVVAAAGRRRERLSESEFVAEFTTAYRGKKIRTVELVRLDRPQAVRYRWLEGPLPHVEEEIRVGALSERRTELTYSGWFSMRAGVIGWVMGRVRVKPVFDALVREHLEDAKVVAERRAKRSRVYAAGVEQEREASS